MTRPFQHITSDDLLQALDGDLLRFTSERLREFRDLSPLCLPTAWHKLDVAYQAKRSVEEYDAAIEAGWPAPQEMPRRSNVIPECRTCDGRGCPMCEREIYR